MRDTQHESEHGAGTHFVSCTTCSETGDEELIRTPGGWVITRWSAWKPSEGHSRFVSRYVAAQWLIRNGHAVHKDLEDFNFETE